MDQGECRQAQVGFGLAAARGKKSRSTVRRSAESGSTMPFKFNRKKAS